MGHNPAMLELALKALIAYLLGTLLGSLILGRLRGVDIRSMGSGNAGATNALRTQGKLFGASVLILDMGKGVLAVAWVPALVLPGVGLQGVGLQGMGLQGMGLQGMGMDAHLPREWLALACGLAVILGHVYPVWFDFRGGKGVATVVGVIGALEPRLLVPLFSCWFIVLLLSGYVGLASMLAGVGLVIAVYWSDPGNTPLLWFCILITAFVFYTHRGNLQRMAAGTESRTRLWLFRSRAV
jgi:glycerol-3-phosphate acyltransferase PlsY